MAELSAIIFSLLIVLIAIFVFKLCLQVFIDIIKLILH